MNRAANELAAVEKVAYEALEPQVTELNDLQLSLIGGGIAEVVFVTK